MLSIRSASLFLLAPHQSLNTLEDANFVVTGAAYQMKKVGSRDFIHCRTVKIMAVEAKIMAVAVKMLAAA